MDRKRLRKFFNDIHLWLGLSSGLILFIVCLSGTVYTFRAEIERWVDSEKYYHGNNSLAAIPADTIIARVELEKQGKVTGMMIPADASMNWQVTVKKDSSKPKTFFVNPATANVVGEQGGSTSKFFTTVMQLHRWLLMEEYGGRIIVGVATIIFVFMILTGLILWFPAKLRLIKQVLTIKTSANWKRINHDLHNTLGFYSFLILLIMALTGLCWSFEWYKNGLSDVLGAKVFKGRGEKPMASKPNATNAQTASVQLLLDKSNEIFNYPGNSRITLPEKQNQAVTVTKAASGFFAVAGSDKVQMDRFTASPLKVEPFADKPLNVKITDSIKIIHTGEIFGTFSKIIYFIVCLIATSLPITGTMIWVNKMKRKNNKPKKLSLYEAKQFA